MYYKESEFQLANVKLENPISTYENSARLETLPVLTRSEAQRSLTNFDPLSQTNAPDDSCINAEPYQSQLNEKVSNKTSKTKLLAKRLYLCNHCGYKNATYNTILNHMRQHTTEKSYKGNLCAFKIVHKLSMKPHIGIRHFRTQQSYTCTACDFKTKLEWHLKLHMRMHSSETPISYNENPYSTCDEASSDREQVASTRELPIVKMPFSCKMCDYRTYIDGNLGTHELEQHVRIHMGEKFFACNACEYEPSRYEYLKLHARTHNKPFLCHVCGYRSSSQLTKHLRIHTEDESYKCTYCEYNTLDKLTLQHHTLRHSTIRPYECHICDYKTSRKMYLITHVNKHAADEPFARIVKGNQDDKRFMCHVCGYRTTDNTRLNLHMNIHTGEKPYECNNCEYKSGSRSELIRHLRTHTGERPYLCYICNYRTTRKTHIKGHMMKHTGEKPFPCMLCDYRSSEKASLRKHMQRHAYV